MKRFPPFLFLSYCRWKYGVMQLGWKEFPDKAPSPYEVIDVIIGSYV